jgi:hypothetical protein
MTNTFSLIKTYTLTSATASFDFTSIPSSFTDLCLKISSRDTSASITSNCYLKFNASTTGYTDLLLYGTGTAVGTLTTSTTGLFYWYNVGDSATASTFSNTQIYIPNYASGNKKNVMIECTAENNGSQGYTIFDAGLWTGTAPINQITITPSSGNFKTYSSASLYGILKA